MLVVNQSFCSKRLPVFVKVFGGKTYFIIPINGKWIQSEFFEVIDIPQFCAYSFGQLFGKIIQLFNTVAESNT